MIGQKKKQNEVQSKNNVQSVADGTFGMSFSIAYNDLHKTSKEMREMNYQDTQQFERATMPKLPIQPLFALKNNLSGEHTLKNQDELLTLVKVLTPEAHPIALRGWVVHFSQDSEIETLTIKADGVAEGSVYWYVDDSSTIYLSNLLVNPNFRNKGVGKKLQEIREQIGKDLNANTSCLWVKKESWMHNLYQRRGYSDLNNHNQEGFIWMTKPLL